MSRILQITVYNQELTAGRNHPRSILSLVDTHERREGFFTVRPLSLSLSFFSSSFSLSHPFANPEVSEINERSGKERYKKSMSLPFSLCALFSLRTSAHPSPTSGDWEVNRRYYKETTEGSEWISVTSSLHSVTFGGV